MAIASFTAGQKLRASDLNAVFAAILSGGSAHNEITTSEGTTSNAAYVDLATVGPSVTITSVGTIALVMWGANLHASVAADTAVASFAVSGATTVAAADIDSIQGAGTVSQSFSNVRMITITPGSNTYTMKYKATGSTHSATYANRRIVVFAP